jgi:nicotinamide-nucleotide amidase
MNAAILAIGNELTSGRSLDTNSAWLADQLGRRGIATVQHVTVGDDRPAIARALTAAAGQGEMVIATGGLGPTNDDLTRHGLADALGAELILDEPSLAVIQSFFDRIGRTMVEGNRIQAMIPAGCRALANSCGTAPGIAGRLGQAAVYITPGVPREMRAMFAEQIAPELPVGEGTIRHEIIRVFGGGESDVAETIEDLMHRDGPVVVGTTVADGLISIRITSRAGDDAAAEAQARAVIEPICQRLGRRVLGIGEEVSMASTVGGLLDSAGATLATAESCTGGLIGAMVTDVPGSSGYYLGGVVAYANAIKESQLGVSREVLELHGAVSAEAAAEMANGVRHRFGSTWGLSTTGIAGPGGGSESKPVGLVFTALAGPAGVRVARHTFPGDRAKVRQRTAMSALDSLRLALLD